jgi:hypothetical protein
MLALLLTLAAAGPARLEEVRFDAPPLTLRLPELEGLTADTKPNNDRIGLWTGTLAGSAVTIQVLAIDKSRLRVVEPEELATLLEGDSVERYAKGNRAAVWGKRDPVQGHFGWLTYASLSTAELREQTAVSGRVWLLCGLTETHGWAVHVEASPPGAEVERAVLAVLKGGVRSEGRAREAQWPEEEVRARWVEFAPDDARDKLEDPIRTEHYIVIGNSSGGKAFAKKMEECYDTIQRLFPFDEVEGRKLMPVFLFRTPDQYYAYFSKRAGISIEQAERSKGHAWLDYYATWYEAPNDPVHIHEATHQIFENRLFLGGGGSWFQEGVAEYVETRPNERGNAARLVKKGRHTPLREFVKIPSLLMSSEEDAKGGDEAGDHYKQAALLIEFLRESKFGANGFAAFLEASGRARSNDVQAIDAAAKTIYGVDLDGLDAEWQKWAERR